MSETSKEIKPTIHNRAITKEQLIRFFTARLTTLMLAILGVGAFLAIVRPRFLEPGNLASVFMWMTYTLVMAIGMTLILILGGIDLSVGAVLGLTGVVTTMLMSKHQPYQLSPPLATALGLGAAAVCGVINGLGVTKLKMAPFIVTLGMMSITRGIATVWTQGWYISGLPDEYLVIGQGEIADIVPYPVCIALLLLIGFHYLLTQWKPLNQIFYIGQNPEAAAMSGIAVNRLTFFTYMISGLLAGIAGIFMTSHLAMGFFQFGVGGELDAIAAAVIGGASMTGGEGNLLGTFLAALLIAVIRNGFVLLGGDPRWQTLVQGLIVFAAIALDAYRRRREVKE